jgi:sugar/nucleoside kinase (ribokinase family)
MDHFLLVDSVTGTILNPAGCYLVHPDHLLDEEEYSDSEAAEIAKEHGTPISADYNLVQCVADALWGDDADTQWDAGPALGEIAEAFQQYRPDLVG